MSFKFNPFTVNLDKVVSSSYLDANYLRLDTTNDPLTSTLNITSGGLVITGNLFAADLIRFDAEDAVEAGVKLDFQVEDKTEFMIDIMGADMAYFTLYFEGPAETYFRSYTDDQCNLGTSTERWKNLYLAGIAHCDDKVEFTETTEFIVYEEW